MRTCVIIEAVCALASCDRALGLDRIHPLADAAPDAGPVDGLVAYYHADARHQYARQRSPRTNGITSR